jgi:SAM-dependent methyltransferase
MPANEWYKHWFNSPFYHKLYFDRDENEAGAFIKKLITHLKPPDGSRMLDIACGKGRHSKTLATLGFQVTGIDISEDSILHARQFENESLEFFTHDMRLPFRINYYDYAFNFFTSFGYFNTHREHDDSIRTIANSLKPNGIFVIDYLNVNDAEDRLVHNEEKKIDETNYTILRWHNETHFFKKIIVDDPSLVNQLVYTEKVTKFRLGDFTDMLSFQGLQVQEVFGDYSLNKYDVQKTPRMIIVAKKTK